MSRPYLDVNSVYVQKYYNKILDCVNDIFEQDFSEIAEYKVPDKYEYGDWKFKVIKSPAAGICLTQFSSKKLKQLIYDDRILLASINKFGPGSIIKEHKDPAYFGKNTFRIFVPLQSKNSYITANFGTIKCEERKPYILDFIYESHSGENKDKNEDFIIIAFDVLYETNQEYDEDYTFNGFSTKKDKVFKNVVNVNMSVYEKI